MIWNPIAQQLYDRVQRVLTPASEQGAGQLVFDGLQMVEESPVRFNTIGLSALPLRYYTPRRLAQIAAQNGNGTNWNMLQG
jgi:hypothetical protein